MSFAVVLTSHWNNLPMATVAFFLFPHVKSCRRSQAAVPVCQSCEIPVPEQKGKGSSAVAGRVWGWTDSNACAFRFGECRGAACSRRNALWAPPAAGRLCCCCSGSGSVKPGPQQLIMQLAPVPDCCRIYRAIRNASGGSCSLCGHGWHPEGRESITGLKPMRFQ